ncbi:MAG: hypothetical protein NC082_03525 [Clostridiales bacterium]|nr:hypothetical protein [Clostridiales bacterium]
MIKSTLKYLSIALAVLVGFTACQDDYFNNINGINGEGTCGVDVQIDFQPIASSVVESRGGTLTPPGDGFGTLRDMCVLIFSADENEENQTLAQIIDIKDGMYTETDITDRGDDDASNGVIAGETSTKRRSLTLNLSIGKFYIYAVSNLGHIKDDVTQSTYDYLTSVLTEGVSTRQDFRKLRFAWDPYNYRNNAVMSGIFTQKKMSGSSVSTGFAESPISVTPGMNIHCWLRRLVSKVTIDFDATNLNPSTTIYLKDVRIKDIPYDCSLVERNQVMTTEHKATGLLDNSKNLHVIQFCKNEADDYKQWPSLTAAHSSLKNANVNGDSQLAQELAKINHSNTAPALFFYENMQGRGESKLQDADKDGTVDSPDSETADKDHYKDNMRCGTYVEVTAYYESNAAGNEGRGNIVYRFMLGKDAIDNYDAERNHHYQLTLRFNGYANDVDWHIRYEKEKVPVIIPNPYYISYGYNEELELPITVAGEIVDGTIEAQIVRNDWYPSVIWEDTEGDKYYHYDRTKVKYPEEDLTKKKALLDEIYAVEKYKGRKAQLKLNDDEGVSLGFLSLRKSQREVVGTHMNLDGATGTVPEDEDRNAYLWCLWMGQDNGATWLGVTNNDYIRDPDKKGDRTLGYRKYVVESTSGEKIYKDNENADDADGTYKAVVTPAVGSIPQQTTLYLPLYTRERNIIKKLAYTGENPYNTNQRRAKVRYKFKVLDSNNQPQQVDTIIDIIQVSKIGNPTGIWRDWNNAAPFRVVLKILENSTSGKYRKIMSKGGWSAEVEYGQDWILLNGGKRKIFGGDGSYIDFTYRPAGVLSSPNKVRCGIIKVKYHNYTCVHRIFVRQGYAPEKILDGGVYGHSFNMESDGVETKSPLDEGSLFRYGKWEYPIASENQVNDFNPWGYFDYNSFKSHTGESFTIAGTTPEVKKTWTEIGSESVFGTSFKKNIKINGVDCRLFTISDVIRLRDGGPNRETYYQYGVLYGDEAYTTADTYATASQYKSNAKTNGMRGCFVYNRFNGRQIFFPIGSTGFGKRKHKGAVEHTAGNVDKSYGWSRHRREIGEAILRYAAGRISEMPDATAIYMPYFYDLYRRPGANYWAQTKGKDDPNAPGYTNGSDKYGLDLNYYTFDFNPIGTELWGGASTQDNEDFRKDNFSDACYIRLIQTTAP